MGNKAGSFQHRACSQCWCKVFSTSKRALCFQQSLSHPPQPQQKLLNRSVCQVAFGPRLSEYISHISVLSLMLWKMFNVIHWTHGKHFHPSTCNPAHTCRVVRISSHFSEKLNCVKYFMVTKKERKKLIEVENPPIFPSSHVVNYSSKMVQLSGWQSPERWKNIPTDGGGSVCLWPPNKRSLTSLQLPCYIINSDSFHKFAGLPLAKPTWNQSLLSCTIRNLWK